MTLTSRARVAVAAVPLVAAVELNALQVGFGRVVTSETEAPNMLANLVCGG